MNKKIQAFTVVEVVIVIVIISVITVITIVSSSNMDAAKEKKLLSQSHTVYSTVEIAYRETILNHTTGGNITSLVDANNDRKVDSEDMKIYMMKYMDGENADCSSFYVADNDIRTKYLNNNLKCFSVLNDIIVGVEYDRNCSLDAQVKEYIIKGDTTLRAVDNGVCTRMIYEPLKSRGLLGHDLFIIALGKLTVK